MTAAGLNEVILGSLRAKASHPSQRGDGTALSTGLSETGASVRRHLWVFVAVLTRSPTSVWSPCGRMSMSGWREQASTTALYLEEREGGGFTKAKHMDEYGEQLLTLAKGGAAGRLLDNTGNIAKPGCQFNPLIRLTNCTSN